MTTLTRGQQKKKHEFKLWSTITNVDDDRNKNSSRMFTIGKALAYAELQMDKAKAKLKQTEASARWKWSKKKIDGKKLNIPQIDSKVNNDHSVVDAENKYLEAKYFFNICKSAVSAMKEKGQQLTNITNSRNAELKLKFGPKGQDERIKNKMKNQLQ